MAAHVWDDGVGVVAPGSLAGGLELQARVRGGLEGVLGCLWLEGRHEAGRGLLGCHLRRVMGLLSGLVRDLWVGYYIVGVHLRFDGGFHIFGGVRGVECAHIRLHLRWLSVGIVLSACRVSCLGLSVSWGAVIHSVRLTFVCYFRVGVFVRVVVAIGVMEHLVVLLLLHWTGRRVCGCEAFSSCLGSK